MRSFASLSERDVLALAISLEEEDARIYEDFADGLKETNPAAAEEFRKLRVEEDGHRHRLLDLYRGKFGDHIPLIRRHDIKGFVNRPPVWQMRPLDLDTARVATSVTCCTAFS
jgi:rubrerythrin